MERKPRRHERLTIYKRMLKDLNEDVNYENFRGFCLQLNIYSLHLKRSSYISDYPELMKYKPKNRKAYWWPVYKVKGYIKRVEVLRSIIKEMESKVAK